MFETICIRAYIADMATEVIVMHEFADWCEDLTEPKQNAVERVVDLLEERGANL